MVRWPSSSCAGGWHFEVFVSAAAQSCAFVLPFAQGIEDVSSTVVSAMGRCRVTHYGFHRVRRADVNGGVLGLRFDEALQPHREDGHVAAGSLSVGNGVEAPGRADVPGGNISVATYELQLSSDESAAAANSTELVGFFVRALNGSSLSFSLRRDETILDLEQRLSVRTGVQQHLFYLVQQSKVLPGSWTLARAGISSDSHVLMCGRLRGGAGGGRVQIEGEWNCQACGMVGCWPTKRQCCRCGTPRGAIGGKPQGPPREQNASNRPPPSPSTGNPTYRVPRKGAPQNQGTSLPVPVPSMAVHSFMGPEQPVTNLLLEKD